MRSGQEIGAVRGVLASVLGMIEGGVTHLGVATDHVVESFRNELYPGYKTSEGVEPELMSQFPILEEALEAMGVRVWAMVEFEADDGLASAAAKAALDERVGKVFICTPDKDLSQCVVGTRVVQMDRRKNEVRDEVGVVEKFGVRPESIPDYLGVVGDSADGVSGGEGVGRERGGDGVVAVLASGGDSEGLAGVGCGDSQRAQRWRKTLSRRWRGALLFRRLASSCGLMHLS